MSKNWKPLMPAVAAQDLRRLAQSAMQQQKFDEAAAQYSLLTKTKSADAMDFFGWGTALCLGGRVEQAIKPLRKAAALNSNHHQIRHALAVAEREVLFVGQLRSILRQIDAELSAGPADSLAAKLARRLMFVGHHFDTLLDRHGATAEGIAGISDAALSPTTATILDHVASIGRPVSLNDIGCGYGRFFSLVKPHLSKEDGSYHGTDIAPKMVAQARELVNDRRATFELSAIPTRAADYSVVIGTFNLSANHDVAEWQDFVHALILATARNSRLGFSFSVLNPTTDPGPLMAARRDLIFDFIANRIGRTASLSHCGPHEWVAQVLLG